MDGKVPLRRWHLQDFWDRKETAVRAWEEHPLAKSRSPVRDRGTPVSPDVISPRRTQPAQRA